MDQTRNRNKYHTKCQSIYKLFVIKSIKLSIHIADKMSDNEDFMADESPEEYSEDEYNSEDDEFLAFHDAEIEAQVRAEVQKMKSLQEEAVRENKKLIASSDKEKIEQVRQQQIDLLGSATLYERINKNLKLTKFEAYFAREQFKLYSWREDFFHEQFTDGSWFTSGADDAHSFDTVPFQITQHFESVVALSASQRGSHVRVYFENDECQAARARNLFDSNTVMYMDNFLEPESLEDHGLRYSDALHIIAAVFPAQPLKLEHLAMKKTLETKVPLDEIPRELQEKAEKEI